MWAPIAPHIQALFAPRIGVLFAPHIRANVDLVVPHNSAQFAQKAFPWPQAVGRGRELHYGLLALHFRFLGLEFSLVTLGTDGTWLN